MSFWTWHHSRIYCPLRGQYLDIAWEGGFQQYFEPLFDTKLS